jgi:hypothetical protein
MRVRGVFGGVLPVLAPLVALYRYMQPIVGLPLLPAAAAGSIAEEFARTQQLAQVSSRPSWSRIAGRVLGGGLVVYVLLWIARAIREHTEARARQAQGANTGVGQQHLAITHPPSNQYPRAPLPNTPFSPEDFFMN